MIEPTSDREMAQQAASLSRSRILDAITLAPRETAGLDQVLDALGTLDTLSNREFRGVLTDAMRELSALLGKEGDARPAALVSAAIAQALVLVHPAINALQGTVSVPPAPVRASRAPSLLPAEAQNRRKVPRVEIETDIGFMSDTNFYAGFSGDISEGGLFVATYELLDIGTSLTLSFVLPNNHQVEATGRVAWLRVAETSDEQLMPGMGVRFDEMSPSDRAAIEEFVHLRQPLFFDHE